MENLLRATESCIVLLKGVCALILMLFLGIGLIIVLAISRKRAAKQQKGSS
jgi:hypothetical protein